MVEVRPDALKFDSSAVPNAPSAVPTAAMACPLPASELVAQLGRYARPFAPRPRAAMLAVSTSAVCIGNPGLAEVPATAAPVDWKARLVLALISRTVRLANVDAVGAYSARLVDQLPLMAAKRVCALAALGVNVPRLRPCRIV